MTATDDLALDALAPDDSARCLVCTHAVDRHDAIGLRYCRASQAQALTRGCICR